MHWPFEVLVVGHIVTGTIGLIAFWIPVISKKGGINHRRFGRIFVNTMLLTGAIASGISICTLIDPVGTHPHLDDVAMVTGIFGWMMLYLAILTVNLAWYGKLCIDNKRRHRGNRAWHNVALQIVLAAAALNCAIQGLLIDQPLMIGMSIIGFATAATNTVFMFKSDPVPKAWLKEHIKGLVGAGISVYTAFFAFGAVRLMPDLALSPMLWSVPLITGLAIIIYHWRKLGWLTRPARPAESVS
ncbi:MAG: hypothetical protein AAFO01_22355 [Pseudomonadota bacterium]